MREIEINDDATNTYRTRDFIVKQNISIQSDNKNGLRQKSQTIFLYSDIIVILKQCINNFFIKTYNEMQ